MSRLLFVVRNLIAALLGLLATVILRLMPDQVADEPYLVAIIPSLLSAFLLGWRESIVAGCVSALCVQLWLLPTDQQWHTSFFNSIRTGILTIQVVALAILCRTYERASEKTRKLEQERDERSESYARFRLLMDSNVFPMKIDSTSDGRTVEANDAFLALMGISREQFSPMRWEDLPAPEYLAADRRARRTAMAKGHAGPCEEVFRRRDGKEVHAIVHMVLLDAASQTVLTVIEDRSRSYELKEQLRQRADALQEEVERKDQFLAMLGHELRNPLSPIMTAAELLGSDALEPAMRDRFRQIIYSQVGVLTRLVDDLLDVARIRQGKVQLRLEPADLKAVVEGAVEAARSLLDERRHQIFVATPQTPLWIECDPKRISQVLTNLLNNAAKYTSPGGCVWLTLSSEKDACLIRVRDTGRGIRPEFLPHIFELFTQDSEALDRPSGGLGLGLPLVRSLVELHGGTVQARSDGNGTGSEFTVRLPCPEFAWKKHSRPAALPAPVQKPLRILIVDDNFAIAETASALLRLDGHHVSVVHDGPSALATCLQFLPHVVLLDVGLPGMDGFEVASGLRKQNPLAILVAVTGYGSQADRQRGEESGFHHYLVKPVESQIIRDVLKVVSDNLLANGSGEMNTAR